VIVGTPPTSAPTEPVVPANSPVLPRSIRTILLATDLSGASEEAARQAIALCRLLSARLLVVNVIDSDRLSDTTVPGPTSARIDQHRTRREGPLLDLVERGRSQGIDGTYLLWTGEAGPGIVAAAEAEGADLIVVGTRGRGRAGRFLLGSVSDYVIYHAGCPVLIAR